ncbi:MAG TPA: hypothetical protein VK059_10000 [Nocardioidaceae bacterium]|nr:hypothetical protein [Nocardioidaceae bacterium]
MTTPYAVYLLLIGAGVFGSLFTLIAITVTFFRERKAGSLW